MPTPSVDKQISKSDKCRFCDKEITWKIDGAVYDMFLSVANLIQKFCNNPIFRREER